MGLTYLWDTNIVIYFLQSHLNKEAETFIDSILAVSDPSISVISEMELRCWKHASVSEMDILNHFIRNATVIELEKEIKDKAIELRKLYAIKLPDAIIAATALIYNLKLISRNIRDFKKIEKVELINPFNL